MSKYKGLFTFDEDNHRYVPIAQADGIIDTMDYEPDYEPDSEPTEPLIKGEKVRKAVRAWADVLGVKRASYSSPDGEFYSGMNCMRLGQINRLESDTYTIAELCGEEEE